MKSLEVGSSLKRCSVHKAEGVLEGVLSNEKNTY